MATNVRQILLPTLVACLWNVGTARAQQTPLPPPDKPVLDALPSVVPNSPAPQRQTNEYGEPNAPTPQEPALTTPGRVDDGFRPARPAQPTTVPTPANRTPPANVGTPVLPPAPTVAPPEPKWFVGGTPAVSFSSQNGISYFSVGASALLGYRVTPKLAIGPGLTYRYASYGGTGLTNFGGRGFAQFLVTDAIFVHVEHEVMRADVPYFVGQQGNTIYYDIRKQTFNSSFGGLGYRQYLGARTMLDAMVLYNLNHESNYLLYGQPEFRFNILFNLNWR